MRFWCSNDGSNWTWAWKPYIGAWVIAAVVALWLWRAGGWRADVPVRRKVALAIGLVLLLGGTDWPLSALGAGYLVSAQLVRQVLIVMIACPLMLYGSPPALGEWLDATPMRRRIVRIITTPLVSLPIAVALLFAVSAPVLVDPLIKTQLGSFALDIAWISAGFLIWLPVQPPTPMVPRLRGPIAIIYLIGVSVAPLPVAFFMTWAPTPIYAVYELAPRVFPTFDAQSDQELAAAIFQVAGGLVIWVQIAVRFVRMAGGGGAAGGPRFRGTMVPSNVSA